MLLASLAAPQSRESVWNDEELADDVATVDYGRAMRAHARLRPETCDVPRDAGQILAGSEHQGARDCRSDASPAPKPLKNASVTIRLSEMECAQLRRRAAEAGMTVSTYLRSCALEAESLRAQVKNALAELRNATPHPTAREKETTSTGGSATLHRLWNWSRLTIPRRRTGIRLNPANPFAPIR